MNKNKSFILHEIADCMKGDDCPICALTKKRIDQALDSFLHECVCDSEVREQVNFSHGFCSKHAKLLKAKGAPLSHAIIYTDIVRDLIFDMRSPKKLAEYTNHKYCRFCDEEKDCEKTYVEVFWEGFSQEDFKAQYAESGMLCAKHLEAVLKVGNGIRGIFAKDTNAEILDLTEQKYKKLLGQLDEVKQKNDYRFAAIPWTDESVKDSWKRAVAVLDDGITD